MNTVTVTAQVSEKCLNEDGLYVINFLGHRLFMENRTFSFDVLDTEVLEAKSLLNMEQIESLEII